MKRRQFLYTPALFSLEAPSDGFHAAQGVCGAPHFDHPGTAAEGQAFFILMEAAGNRLERR